MSSIILKSSKSPLLGLGSWCLCVLEARLETEEMFGWVSLLPFEVFVSEALSWQPSREHAQYGSSKSPSSQSRKSNPAQLGNNMWQTGRKVIHEHATLLLSTKLSTLKHAEAYPSSPYWRWQKQGCSLLSTDMQSDLSWVSCCSIAIETPSSSVWRTLVSCIADGVFLMCAETPKVKAMCSFTIWKSQKLCLTHQTRWMGRDFGGERNTGFGKTS